jgi:glycerate kinase
MRALLAFDKFKDCMSAPDACAAAAAALRGCRPDWMLDLCPLTDGGEGFVDVLTTAGRGALRAVTVTGPRGDLVSAPFGLIPVANIPSAVSTQLGLTRGGMIAVVEMAAASGLALIPPAQRDPWQTTTRGTGELIREAAEAGASAILLGIGGSATNDLGLGALTALGLEWQASERVPTAAAPANWGHVTRISGRLRALPPLFIACDVTNPLLGPHGAAAVYGPQKGLRASEVKRLDHEAARMALLLAGHFRQPDTLMEMPGAGAAGGIGFGLMAALGAKLLPGFDLVAQWIDLEARIAAANVVVTGEGRFDQSSLSGKGPGAITRKALARGKRIVVLAGSVDVTAAPDGLELRSITPSDIPVPAALAAGPDYLAAAIREVFGSRT